MCVIYRFSSLTGIKVVYNQKLCESKCIDLYYEFSFAVILGTSFEILLYE